MYLLFLGFDNIMPRIPFKDSHMRIIDKHNATRKIEAKFTHLHDTFLNLDSGRPGPYLFSKQLLSENIQNHAQMIHECNC